MKMKKMTKGLPGACRGFTLIELLVVIAIIGVLATIALAALNSARSKSADASVKANMANIAAQAELYYADPAGGNGSYTPVGATQNCTVGMFQNANIQAMLTAAENSSNKAQLRVCSADGTASAGGQKWAVMVGGLKGDGSAYRNWCVDSSGAKGFVANTVTTLSSGVCPTVSST
jgi:prepilin-type N-terminal cleavage/methylation domain-containing protein